MWPFIFFFPFDLMQSDVGESSGQRRMIQILARMQMRFVMECMGSFDIFLKSVLGTWVVFCHYVISPCNTFFWPTGTNVFRSTSIEKGYRRCITVSYKRPFSFKDFFPEIDNYFLGIHGDELGIHTGWKSLDDLYKVKKVLLHYSIFLSSLVKVGSQEELAFFIITVMLLRASSQVLCSQKLNLAICFLCLPYDTVSFNLLSICSVQQCLDFVL